MSKREIQKRNRAFLYGEAIAQNRGDVLVDITMQASLALNAKGEENGSFVLKPQKQFGEQQPNEQQAVDEQKNTRKKNKAGKWKTFLFSEVLVRKNTSHKIAYIAVMTALIVAANMFEFKLADTQFSFTLLISALTGIIIGPLFGFAACFLGDLVGFLYHSAGFAYMPWIGLSMGLTATIAGGIVNGISLPKGWGIYVKLVLVSLLTFGICTVAINTTAFWLLYSKTSYQTYLVARLFVQGQIWNSLVNYVLLFVAVPILSRIKPLKLHIK